MIRAYEHRDLQDVLAAWTAASAVAHPFLSEEFMTAERHNIETVYLPNAETWVWEKDGRVVGFIAMAGDEIGGLFVDPEFHRAGIGRALVEHVRGPRPSLEVEVFKANALGRAFYEAHGFVPMRETRHDATGQPLLRLELTR